MIYHVVSQADWQVALSSDIYQAASLVTEGFIHLSKEDQVAGVLERYYTGRSDLLLLHVDETKLLAELKYEQSPSVNESFPHLYGPLNLDAVVAAMAIKAI